MDDFGRVGVVRGGGEVCLSGFFFSLLEMCAVCLSFILSNIVMKNDWEMRDEVQWTVYLLFVVTGCRDLVSRVPASETRPI